MPKYWSRITLCHFTNLHHVTNQCKWAKLQTHKVVQIYKSFEKNHQILKMHSNCFIIQAVGSKYIHQLSIWQPRHNLPQAQFCSLNVWSSPSIHRQEISGVNFCVWRTRWTKLLFCFFCLMAHFKLLFIIFGFSIKVIKCSVYIADDKIRTGGRLMSEQLLCQLCHNQCSSMICS